MKTNRIIVEIRSERVKVELARAGKTYSWLAGQIGVHRHYVSALMRHVRNPGPKKRERIHKAMAQVAMLGWREIFREVKR